MRSAPVILMVSFIINFYSCIPYAVSFLPGNYSNRITQEILSNPYIEGVLISARWKDIEVMKNKFNWSLLDNKINEAINSKKCIILNIMTTGVNVPSWVLTEPGVKTFTFKAVNPNQPIYGQEFTVPVYWDETYLKCRDNFLMELGERYSQNKYIVGVMISFLGTINNDWYIPRNSYSDLINKGYTTDKMFNVGKRTMDIWALVFPQCALKIPIGISIPDSGNTITTLAERILDYGYSKYPDRFYAQINGLSTKIPLCGSDSVQNSDQNDPFYLLKLLSEHPNHIGFQMLCDATNHSERLDKGSGCKDHEPLCVFELTLSKALSYHPYYIEYWYQDIENQSFQDSLRDISKILHEDNNFSEKPK